jgi:hypothetical protein
MSTQEENDRREYYRIEDTIALDFHVLDSDASVAGEELHDPSPLFNLLSELNTLDFDSQYLLRNISERDRTLAIYLKNINKRIDLIAQSLAQSLLRDSGQFKQVTLSEGGINFRHTQALALGSYLALKMVLMPQALGLLLKAKVLHCAEENGQFEIGAKFEALSDPQRQLLARHVLQRQAQERRQAREESP